MMNIELEERAKKQEVERADADSQRILPPEKPLETLIVPAPDSVSRESFDPRRATPLTPPPKPALPPAETPVNGSVADRPDA